MRLWAFWSGVSRQRELVRKVLCNQEVERGSDSRSFGFPEISDS